ncbi:hypothetical protein [Nocardioides limicola]|uniref:hypothetical protein n=1 Tax=Nocardioides limicola TaxID=2803368 RepID=UPI00193AF837|nr:hypothetical protein [Nocardioides sp. DJM-14]
MGWGWRRVPPGPPISSCQIPRVALAELEAEQRIAHCGGTVHHRPNPGITEIMKEIVGRAMGL